MIKFQGIGAQGNYSQAGKAVADDTLRAFLAARRSAPDYGEIALTSAELRKKEKLATLKNQTDVAAERLAADTLVKAKKIGIAAESNLKSAKRKAGVLAVSGSMFAKASDLYSNADRKLRETGTNDEYYDRQRARAQKNLDEAQSDIDKYENFVYSEPEPPTISEEVSNSSVGNTNGNLLNVAMSQGKSSATPSRAAAFNTIYDAAKRVGGTKFPEVVAAQAMHETGWLSNPNSVYFNSGKTNPFGQTGDRGYGTIPRAGFPDGWTLYPDIDTATKDNIKLWHDVNNHPANYNAFDNRNEAIRSVASAYSPNSDKENIRLGYTENGYSRGVNAVLEEMGF